MRVTAICERIGCEANLVSHHLGCLRDCQLVDAEREGRRKFYAVSRPEAIEMVELADDCIHQNVENVLGCSVVADGEGRE